MAFNDGYGEQLSPEQMEEEIKTREGLLRLKASERVYDLNKWDDVLAEGRIVIWTVLQKRPDAPGAYVSAAMSNRISETSMRGNWTGHTPHRGTEDITTRRVSASFDDPEFNWDPAAPDALDKVLLAYHEGEIMEALHRLSQPHREYVVQRFWGGRTNAEIAALQGTTKAYEANQWERSIKPALVAALAHMGA